MHPVLVEMLQKPVGWLMIVGTIILFGTPLAVGAFLRKKIRDEEARNKHH